LHFGTVNISQNSKNWIITTQVYLGDLTPQDVRVELYAEVQPHLEGICYSMQVDDDIPGSINGYIYGCEVSRDRPAEHYVPRIVPGHNAAAVPIEAPFILWQR
jgi:starch phosphorylase